MMQSNNKFVTAFDTKHILVLFNYIIMLNAVSGLCGQF